MFKETFKSYLTGFVLSIILTVAAYVFVHLHVASGHVTFPHGMLTVIILTLAVVQLLVQLTFFLHLADESKPRWNLVVLLSTFVIILILVVGSIWIMNHLNYNMTPAEVNAYLLKND